MPKIVDHDAYSDELALSAAAIFLEYGYSSLGMRQLASELGVSKSKLYHYFPTKEALFSAATESIIKQDIQQLKLDGKALTLNEQARIMVELIDSLLPRYANELKLVLEYMQVIGVPQVKKDPIMQLAQEKYRALFESVVGGEKAEMAYSVTLGILVNRVMSGDDHCLPVDKSLIRLLLK